jgi:uncharacterized protein (UPF0335 family)
MSNVETTVTHIGAPPPPAGHNTVTGNTSVPKEGLSAESAQKVKSANAQLKSIIDRIERVEEEKKGLSDDIRDMYAEAKGNGYDVKALRTIVRLRKQDANERAEQETILETYMQALGMV